MVLQKTTLLGFAVVTLSLLSHESSDTAVQALQSAIPDFQLSAIRYTGLLGVSAAWLVIRKYNLRLSVDLYVPLILLSVTSLGFNILYFYAVAILPLSHAEALLVCTRMILFVFLAALTKRITLNIFNVLSVVGCTVGVLMIVQPWKPFDQGFTVNAIGINESISHQNNMSGHSNVSVSKIISGYTAVIASGTMGALYFYIAAFYLRSVPSAIQCLVMGCLCLPSSILLSLYIEQPVLLTNSHDIILAAVHAISTGSFIISANASFQLLDPILVPIILNIQAVLGLIPQYTFMRKYLSGRMNIMEVLGCIAIFVIVSISSFLSTNTLHEDLQD